MLRTTLELPVPEPTISRPAWFTDEAPGRATSDVRQGRRRGDTGWLVVRARGDGGEDVMLYASEAEARAAAETQDEAAGTDCTSQVRQGPVNMVELLLHRPKWWR